MVSFCAAAVMFLLYVLFALIREEARVWRAKRAERMQAKRTRARAPRREALIVVDGETLKGRFAIRAGKYWLLAGMAAFQLSISGFRLWR